MAEFPITIVLDPKPAVRAQQTVTSALEATEAEALRAKTAMQDALSVRATGTQSSVERVETSLNQSKQAAVKTRAAVANIGAGVKTKGVQKLKQEVREVGVEATRTRRLLRGAFAGVSVFLLTKQVIGLSDELTNVQNRLRLVTQGESELAAVQQELFSISEDTRSSFEGTATIFSRLAQSSDELGKSNTQLLSFTKSLNQAIVLSGASAIEAKAGLIQLSQGLASGALRGDELRSVLEQLPAVARVIAKDLGVTIGQLRLLGQEGKITSDVIIGAFERASTQLEQDFATTVPTIGQSFTVLENKILSTVGSINEATGASESLASGVLLLAENLDGVVTVTIGLSTAIGVRLAGKAIPAAILQMKALTVATVSSTAAFAALAGGVVFLTSKIRAYNADLAEIGKTLRQIEEDSSFVPTLGVKITSAQRQINALNRTIAAQQQRGVGASESQLAALAKLKSKIAELRGEVVQQTAAAKASANAALEAAAAEKVVAEATERQTKLLEKLRTPELQRKQRLEDLTALLKQGKIAQDEFNAAAGKTPGPAPKAPVSRVVNDPFVAQLASVQRLNEELLIKARTEGLSREVLLAELDLRRQGITLTVEQRAQLAESLALRQELTNQIQAQTGATQESVAVTEEALRRQLEASQQLEDGFARAFLRIQDEANNLAAVGDNIVNAFSEEAVSAVQEFVQTGTFEFGKFTDAVLADIQQILTRLLVMQAITALGGGGIASAGLANVSLNAGRAKGGTVQGGQNPMEVGENGTELLIPGRTTTIIPNSASQPQAAPKLNLTLVTVASEEMVAEAIANGPAGEVVIQKIGENSDRVNQMLS